MQIQKLKLAQQNSNEGSINLAGGNKKATLKCKKIIIKTLAKLHTTLSTVTLVGFCKTSDFGNHADSQQECFQRRGACSCC